MGGEGGYQEGSRSQAGAALQVCGIRRLSLPSSSFSEHSLPPRHPQIHYSEAVVLHLSYLEVSTLGTG